jgi:hypothetical protein
MQPISQTLVHRNKDALETMAKKHLMGREPTFINTLSAFLILKGTFKVEDISSQSNTHCFPQKPNTQFSPSRTHGITSEYIDRIVGASTLPSA